MARAWLHLNKRAPILACAKESEHTVELPEKVGKSRVLVVGGTGRVGGSTAVALSKLCPDLRIVVAGRNWEKGAAAVAKLGKNSKFAEVDIDDMESLEKALHDVDLVVHTAGPFQQADRCTVLEAAIQTKTAYIDICDDTRYAWRAKSYMSKALAANIPAITTGGIYPGVSNVMAAELVRAARNESKGEPQRLRFSYYTAGTGGAGPTILATSFLLLGEEVVAYSKGEKIKLKPYSGMLNIDFGKGIGKRDVYLLDLPEVTSAHEVLGVPTVSARFGTSPFFWNWGMEVMTNLLPVEFLRDRSKVQNLVQLFDPVVRAVDGIAGERVSMRVDLECSDGRNTLALFSHRRLSVSVGFATAAFVLAILEGSTQPGVWFPEEPEGIAIEAREALLRRAVQGTISFVMNKPPWMVETDPKELGLGIYL
ncbi:Carboxynorspermidine synthase [Actinidia chinensis var. chinensis]|uniref:Carboxynorspermidine synthase n=1 Tax=Actinidia chinensis var. chinensis TaxID=1590841 RepID=A0A2R6R6H9_ACTCC|nr:Carboxynorspermidine synthase [Actinidia chinensis var. chinensis]